MSFEGIGNLSRRSLRAAEIQQKLDAAVPGSAEYWALIEQLADSQPNKKGAPDYPKATPKEQRTKDFY